MEKTKHAHAVADQDLPFVIDPITKEVQPQGLNRVVPQHAKNSERFTFTIPDRYIEGHDMSLVNQAFVHFRNVGAQGQLSAGIYKVEDLAVADDSVTLSWLIDDDATYYVGALIFSIHFICTDESGEVVYDLPTLAYTKISVGETVWNSEEITAKYPDIIAELEARISAIEAGGVPGGTVTPIAYLYNGVELPALPDWDKEAYPYAYIRAPLGMAAGYHFYVSPMPWRYHEEEDDLPNTGAYGYVDLPDGESISYYSSALNEEQGQWEDFGRFLMSNKSGIVNVFWSNKPIYNKADGTLYMNGSDPVPVYPEGGGGAVDAVLYTEQTLTPEQQEQARENIGVGAKTIDLTGHGIALGDMVTQSLTGNRLVSDTGELWEEINCGRELEFKIFDDTETLIVFPSSQTSRNGEIFNVSFSVQLVYGSGLLIGSVSLTKSSPEDNGGTVSTQVSWVTNITELPEPEEV